MSVVKIRLIDNTEVSASATQILQGTMCLNALRGDGGFFRSDKLRDSL